VGLGDERFRGRLVEIRCVHVKSHGEPEPAALKRPDADDERRVLVTLTADGLALRDRLASVPQSFLHCLGMDPAEAGALRDQLAALMTKIG